MFRVTQPQTVIGNHIPTVTHIPTLIPTLIMLTSMEALWVNPNLTSMLHIRTTPTNNNTLRFLLRCVQPWEDFPEIRETFFID